MSTATISLAVSINVLLFRLTAPFAAALMERFGVRRVVASALVVVTTGSATGQLDFLPVVAVLSDRAGWRTAALVIAGRGPGGRRSCSFS